MKFSSWLVNNSTPVARDWVANLARSVNPELHAYLVSVERVLKRERELQRAHMYAFDPTRVKPEQVTHLDCNVLRIWPDMGIAELIKFYTYRADILCEFAAARWAMGERHGAHQFKLARRRYEQALIKLKRERDRRKRVYNLS